MSSGLGSDDEKFILEYILNAAGRVPPEVSYAEARRALALVRTEASEGTADEPKPNEDAGHASSQRTLKVSVYQSPEGAPVRAVIATDVGTSVLQREPAEALLILIERGSLQREEHAGGEDAGYMRFYNAMKLLKSRLKEVGMGHAISSKRGHGYYWNRAVAVELEEKAPAER